MTSFIHIKALNSEYHCFFFGKGGELLDIQNWGTNKVKLRSVIQREAKANGLEALRRINFRWINDGHVFVFAMPPRGWQGQKSELLLRMANEVRNTKPYKAVSA